MQASSPCSDTAVPCSRSPQPASSRASKQNLSHSHAQITCDDQAVTACLLNGPTDPSRVRALAERRPTAPTRGRSSSWDAVEPLSRHGRSPSNASDTSSSIDREALHTRTASDEPALPYLVRSAVLSAVLHRVLWLCRARIRCSTVHRASLDDVTGRALAAACQLWPAAKTYGIRQPVAQLQLCLLGLVHIHEQCPQQHSLLCQFFNPILYSLAAHPAAVPLLCWTTSPGISTQAVPS